MRSSSWKAIAVQMAEPLIHDTVVRGSIPAEFQLNSAVFLPCHAVCGLNKRKEAQELLHKIMHVSSNIPACQGSMDVHI